MRDYLHVLDLAKGHLLALDALAPESKVFDDCPTDACYKAYTLGRGKGMSVLQIVEAGMRKATGFDFKYEIDWLPIIYNMLSFLQDPLELTIRSNAATALKRFIDYVADERGEHEETFLNVLYPGVKNGLRSRAELVRAEILGVLSHAISRCTEIACASGRRRRGSQLLQQHPSHPDSPSDACDPPSG